MDPFAVGPEEVTAALRRLIDDDEVRAAAAEIRGEIAAQPPLHAVAERLTRLTAGVLTG